MKYSNEVEIRDAGFMAVRKWLKQNEWKDIEDIILKNDQIDIGARKDSRSIIVSVKSSIYPIDPGFLSIDQRGMLRSVAVTRGANPKFARVWLNEDLSLKDERIMWSRV